MLARHGARDGSGGNRRTPTGVTGFAPSTAGGVHLQPGLHGLRGALGEVFAEKIHKVMDCRINRGSDDRTQRRCGARIQEAWCHCTPTRIFTATSRVRRDPQISVIMALRRRAVTPRHDRLHLHGPGLAHVHHRPDVVKTVTGEDVTLEELGAP